MSDKQAAENLRKILRSPSYRVAYKDVDFLASRRLRPMRMQLELLKAELALQDHDVRSTIVVFGSTRIVDPATAQEKLERAQAQLADTPSDPRRQRAVARAERVVAKCRYYEVARQFAALVSKSCQGQGDCDYVVITGGGPGIMEAANRGAYEVGAKSVGLNVRLPHEQQPNPYITPELCFQFHYFAMRKFHFILRAKALVVFPGGFGTLDELFDALTLRQTGRMQDIPIIIFGREYWRNVVDFQYLADEGTIDDEDLDLFRYADTADEAWEMIRQFHHH
ncbi:MAG: TIGR00730 family Rossman fold protein [Pirellulales bacterium]|nr:TIGR00730 family Rossman fold protein [Pirellulales bacterium]